MLMKFIQENLLYEAKRQSYMGITSKHRIMKKSISLRNRNITIFEEESVKVSMQRTMATSTSTTISNTISSGNQNQASTNYVQLVPINSCFLATTSSEVLPGMLYGVINSQNSTTQTTLTTQTTVTNSAGSAGAQIPNRISQNLNEQSNNNQSDVLTSIQLLLDQLQHQQRTSNVDMPRLNRESVLSSIVHEQPNSTSRLSTVEQQSKILELTQILNSLSNVNGQQSVRSGSQSINSFDNLISNLLHLIQSYTVNSLHSTLVLKEIMTLNSDIIKKLKSIKNINILEIIQCFEKAQDLINKIIA